MNGAIIPMEDAKRKRILKHDPKAWCYMDDRDNPAFASACSCGHTRVDLPDMETAVYIANHHWLPSFEDPTPTREEILITSKDHEVKVVMTDQEAYEILLKTALERAFRGYPSNFMESLAETFRDRGTWSDGQRPWAHKLANEVVEPKPEPEVSSETFPKLVEMLHIAAGHLKFPRIVVKFDEGTIRLNIGGPKSKIPGALNVTSDGAYEDRTWYGRIYQDSGKFEASRNCPEWVLAVLIEFNADPAGTASLQGQRYGNCCFCRLELTTNESLAVGYGPICADHYGLPWGHTEE